MAALLAQAQIYENDLHDAAAAKETISLLVKQYPRSALAEEARAGMASLERGEGEPRDPQRAVHKIQRSMKEQLSKLQVLRRKRRSLHPSFAAMPTTGEAREAKATPDANVVAAPERRGISDPVDGELDAVRKQASADAE